MRSAYPKAAAAAFGLAVALCLSAPARAGETLRIKAIVVGHEGVGFNVGERPSPVTIHLNGERSRVDFNGRGAEAIHLLVDEQTRRGWIIDSGQSRAIPMVARGFGELLVDPEAPCARLGVRCRPVPSRVIAGVRAQGWRYMDADRRGPGGTSRGEFWVDPARGLILAYEGHRNGRSRTYRMQAMSVTPVEDADALFELPRGPGGKGAGS